MPDFAISLAGARPVPGRSGLDSVVAPGIMRARCAPGFRV